MTIRFQRTDTSDGSEILTLVRADDPNAALLSAAKLAARLLGTGNPLQDFEDIGDWFYSETFMLRPGKSDPLAMGETDMRERERVFREWIGKKYAAARLALADAIAAVEAAEARP